MVGQSAGAAGAAVGECDTSAQVVFSPVDVRTFQGSQETGPVLQHCYRVTTSREKLEQYLRDASPLVLGLLGRRGEAVGRATVTLGGEEAVEGYYPVWSEGQGREVANLHVRLAYREEEEKEEEEQGKQESVVTQGQRAGGRRKVLGRKSEKDRGRRQTSEERRKVTFSEGEAASPLLSSVLPPTPGTPIADCLITDLLNQVREGRDSRARQSSLSPQSACLRATMQQQLAEADLGLEEGGKENVAPGRNGAASAGSCPLPQR